MTLPEDGLPYAEAAARSSLPAAGGLVVIDMTTRGTVFATPDDEAHRGFCSMAVDADGRIMFSRPEGVPARRSTTCPRRHRIQRQQNPDVLFALEPEGGLREPRRGLHPGASRSPIWVWGEVDEVVSLPHGADMVLTAVPVARHIQLPSGC